MKGRIWDITSQPICIQHVVVVVSLLRDSGSLLCRTESGWKECELILMDSFFSDNRYADDHEAQDSAVISPY